MQFVCVCVWVVDSAHSKQQEQEEEETESLLGCRTITHTILWAHFTRGKRTAYHSILLL